jgi:hypothetical protein
MRARFLVVATIAGGLVLFVLNALAARVLPPRFQQFRDARAVNDAVRGNAAGNGMYSAPGLFVAASDPLKNIGMHLVAQLAAEFAVALGLAVILLAMPVRSALLSAALLGLIGLVAGFEMRFPDWNWTGFPASHLLAGSVYLSVNWFLTGLVIAGLRRKVVSE